MYWGGVNIVFADTLEEIRKRTKIIIGIDINYQPYGFINKDAKIVGYDVEVAELISKDLDVELEIIPTTMPNRVPYLLSKKTDIVIAVFTITEERKKVLDFSNPYAVASMTVAGKKADNIKSLGDL